MTHAAESDQHAMLRTGVVMREALEDLRAQRAIASDPKNIAFLEAMAQNILGGLVGLGYAMGRQAMKQMVTPEQLAEFDAQQDR
jgi:hypothetical protein